MSVEAVLQWRVHRQPRDIHDDRRLTHGHPSRLQQLLHELATPSSVQEKNTAYDLVTPLIAVLKRICGDLAAGIHHKRL